MFSLTSDQTDLQARARTFADEVLAPRAAEVDRTEQYPWDNVAAMKDAGFLGMTVPQAHGGQGLGWLETSLVVEQIART